MRAYAVLRCQGEEHIVGHGDLIGRTPTAGIVLDDPRISEAHAIVSVRKGELHLLSLRRLVIASGKPVNEVRLEVGTSITLVDELVLEVCAVVEPATVLAVVLPSGERQVLPQVASLTTSPPRIHGKLLADAPAVVWSTGERWRIRIGTTTSPLAPDDAHVVDGVRFAFELVPIAHASIATTAGGAVATTAPVRVVAFYDSVQIYQRGQKVHVVGGTGARILSELVACGGPTRWEVLAREVWPDEIDVTALRHRWDVALGRLRMRLRHANVRELVKTDGTGQLALELYAGDVVEDCT